ncbi:MAG: 2-C-methyl-D-erythritol 4-phosphate cytidylyltransferase [Acidobacteria bacterium]|jgi:2-C-methyl-D-erythritol 4-phosphate cytidylyltransferase|nr:2-C-methyl-D-erythritol 4-phosphate cytidylyltransferase [Acidobacteriota bacterium]
MKVAAIIPAAGIGTRMGPAAAVSAGASRKQFMLLDGVPVIVHTLRKFAATPLVWRMFVAVRPVDHGSFLPYLQQEPFADRVEIVSGGDYRQESVENCLLMVPPDTDLVAVHDAVRPFVEVSAIERAIREAEKSGAAILGIPSVDTVKQVEMHLIRGTIPRERIVLAQTPQVFRYQLLKQAFERAAEDGFQATDEASLVEHFGADIVVVLGSDRNLKITKPSDLELAKFFLQLEREGKGEELRVKS